MDFPNGWEECLLTALSEAETAVAFLPSSPASLAALSRLHGTCAERLRAAASENGGGDQEVCDDRYAQGPTGAQEWPRYSRRVARLGSLEWRGAYFCDAVAAETLRLSASYRPRPPPASIRFDSAPAGCLSLPTFATRFEVTGEDSLEAARRLVALAPGPRPLVLNMANPDRPGGGFVDGSAGQEEELCRRSTLFCELAEAVYPLAERGGVVSPDVVVIRGAGPSYLELEQRFHVAIATAAAPIRPNLSSEASAREYEALMGAKVEALLLAGAAQGYRRLVLSAWGCGAFHNPPEVVARLFRAALGRPPFASAFEHVVFAVLDRWDTEHNLPEFERAFADLVAGPAGAVDRTASEA